jgi:tryptophan synthase alpha chain
MNRLNNLFKTKSKRILSVYFTAGFPTLESVPVIIRALEENGADIIEIGIPYSDPLADGPVIQESGNTAIMNGMTVENLFLQLKDIRSTVKIPLLFMGYLNPILKFGFEKFCVKARETGIDGLIIPDLPADEFKKSYEKIVRDNNLSNIFLVTPDTSESRIREIDSISGGFIYIVSSASTTGKTSDFEDKQTDYLKRIESMNLRNPILAGFGVHNRQTIEKVFAHCTGAIIGTAFIKKLIENEEIEKGIIQFFNSLNE